MTLLLKIFGRAVIYGAIAFSLLIIFVLNWSYGQKKSIPANIISSIERVLESATPDSQIYIASAQLEFTSFEEGLGIVLDNSYIQLQQNMVVSVPQIKIRLKLLDVVFARLKLRDITLEDPRFVISYILCSIKLTRTAMQYPLTK